jgi:hypothetical protein
MFSGVFEPLHASMRRHIVVYIVFFNHRRNHVSKVGGRNMGGRTIARARPKAVFGVGVVGGHPLPQGDLGVLPLKNMLNSTLPYMSFHSFAWPKQLFCMHSRNQIYKCSVSVWTVVEFIIGLLLLLSFVGLILAQSQNVDAHAKERTNHQHL